MFATHARPAVFACALTVTAGTSLALNTSVSLLYSSDSIINGVQIDSPFLLGDDGFRDLSVNDTGLAFLHVGLAASVPFNEAILRSSLGNDPFLPSGFETEPWGGFTIDADALAPLPDHAMYNVLGLDTNNTGKGAFALRTGDGEFTDITPTSGLFFNRTQLLLEEGDVAAFDAGSTWDPFVSTVALSVNNADQWLLGHSVTKTSTMQSRRVIVRLNTNGAGSVTGTTLIASEGGSVPGGLGGETWASLSMEPHTVAMNDLGQVIYSGTTSAGRELVVFNGSIIARTGGPTPLVGRTWSSLYGAPVDVNDSGQWVLRGPLASNATWTELGDAGEDASQDGTAQVTLGSGPLTSISGRLSDSHDVDVYQITVSDPAVFSATTVGSPDDFDSVIHLVRTVFNRASFFRVGVSRNDDTSLVEQHATIGNTHLSPSPRDYYITVSTRQAVIDGFYPESGELWQRDPWDVAAHNASQTLYWVDASEGQIQRARYDGTPLSPIQVAAVPTVSREEFNEVRRPIDIDQTNNKVYYKVDLNGTLGGLPGGVFGSFIRRMNLDGTNVEDVVSTGFDISDFDIDEATGKLCWAQNPFGTSTVTIQRANLNGTGIEPLVPSSAGTPGPAQGLAIDSANNTVYYTGRDGIIYKMVIPYVNSASIVPFVTSVPGGCPCDWNSSGGVNFFDLLDFLDDWFQSNADFNMSGGTNFFDLLDFLDCWFESSGSSCGGDASADVGAHYLDIDHNTNTLYWAHRDTGRLYSTPLTGAGAGQAQLVLDTGSCARGVTIDPVASRLFWTDPCERALRASTLGGGSPSVVYDLGPDVGDRTSDGPGYPNGGVGHEWIKTGSATGGARDYTLTLSGVSFTQDESLIVRNGSDVIARSSMSFTAISPYSLIDAGSASSPVYISDSGDVAWWGFWDPETGGPQSAVFLNDEIVLDTSVTSPWFVGTITNASSAFSMSDNGQWFLIDVVDSRPFDIGGGGGSQGDAAILVEVLP